MADYKKIKQDIFSDKDGSIGHKIWVFSFVILPIVALIMIIIGSYPDFFKLLIDSAKDFGTDILFIWFSLCCFVGVIGVIVWIKVLFEELRK